MNCEILETLYLKSNGLIPCNDDVGEEVILGRVDASDSEFSVRRLVRNEQ